MENRCLPFVPVDFRRKPEPEPLLEHSLTIADSLEATSNRMTPRTPATISAVRKDVGLRLVRKMLILQQHRDERLDAEAGGLSF